MGSIPIARSRSPSAPLPFPQHLGPADTILAEYRDALLHWYDEHGRTHLPWMTEPSPYRIWVSEIMLQQTRVVAVLGYFERFVERFPSVESLAAAPLEEVLGLWSGLGYYARARNLHRTARLLVEEYDGRFPQDVERLASLPGIGRSTAGAIAAKAFHRRAPILDGNVKRVLARRFGVEGWPGAGPVQRELWRLSDRCTPAERVADYTQAIMDLGAMVCLPRRPLCDACPLAPGCAARREGRVHEIPAARPPRDLPVREAVWLIARDPAGAVLLRQNPPLGLWGELWVFPCWDSVDEASRWALENLHLHASAPGSGLLALPARRHSFSHFHLDYTPLVCDLAVMPVAGVAESNQQWHQPGTTPRPPMPSPVAAILAELTCGAGPWQPPMPEISKPNRSQK